MTNTRRLIGVLTALLLCIAAGIAKVGWAAPPPAEDITGACEIVDELRRWPTHALTDGKYTSRWVSKESAAPALRVHAPRDTLIGSVYICFGEMPPYWEIQLPYGDDEWLTYAKGDTRFLHAFVTLPDVKTFRVVVYFHRNSNLIINEMFLFGPGEAPDWVQRWEPTAEKADLMLLVAHPDDELVNMGGAIPAYAVNRELNTVVVYMTSSNTTRSSELLNGLWHMGLRQYPVLGPFADQYTNDLAKAYRYWPKDQSQRFVMELIRRHKPEVIISHDVKGEYGHGAHMAAADLALYGVQNAGDADVFPDLAALYGVWTPQKLYLHLYPERRVVMDWSVPITGAGGKTALELAQEAYALHVTQRDITNFEVADGGRYDNALFGLAHTTVGDDTLGNDFFENVAVSPRARVTPTPMPEPATSPTPTPGPTPTPTPRPTRTPKPTPTPRPTRAPTPTPGPTPAPQPTQAPAPATESASAPQSAPMPEPAPNTGLMTSPPHTYAPYALGVDWPITPAPRDGRGFLLEGESLYADEEAGVWFYASPTLVVRIDRKRDPEIPLVWYEAHLHVNLEKGERVGSFLMYPEEIYKNQKRHVQPAQIARENQVVFSMSTDYYTYRIGRNSMVGAVIRGGQILYDNAPAHNRSKFPNLDTLAMFSDGSWLVFYSDEYTAEELLAMGAVDVFCFGPYLVRDGQLNPFVEMMYSGKTTQPRCAIGMIKPGHYFAALAEGGMARESVGVTIAQLAECMRAAGCTQALNLDGGQTGVILFMGEQISRIAQYSGGRTHPRASTEILGVGRSELAGPAPKE